MRTHLQKPQTVNEYLATLTTDKRTALNALRRKIKTAAPKAVECISYGIPSYRLNGRLFVSFAAAKKHLSFFPGAHPIKVHQRELEDYATSKGTIRFPIDDPLPATLVRKLVRARLAEYAAKY